MVHFITLYSFLIRKKKTAYVKNCLTINNWKHGIYQDEYNGVGYYKNDKLHGPYHTRYSNGRLWVKCYYKNDKLHCKYYIWDYYRQLWIKCYYKNNKLHGKYYEWNEQGNLIKKLNILKRYQN